MIGAKESIARSSVAQRRAARTAQLIESAWRLAQEHGVGGVTLHALARDVGIRQPSLYEYFASKDALFDAMFADGNRRLLEHLEAVKLPSEPRAALKRMLRAFAEFALADPARGELLFERHVPGFVPSPESYAIAGEAMDRVVVLMHGAGAVDPADIDCLVAITAGLMTAQRANDPGGRRWIRHLDRMVDLYLDDVARRSTT